MPSPAQTAHIQHLEGRAKRQRLKWISKCFTKDKVPLFPDGSVSSYVLLHVLWSVERTPFVNSSRSYHYLIPARLFLFVYLKGIKYQLPWY